MSVVVVVPVKRFAQAKMRLAAGGLTPGDRVALATGMLTDVLEALRRCRLVDDVLVVTGERGAEVLARTYGAQVLPDDPHDGHSGAVARGIAWAVEDGAFHVVLVPGDAPALDAAELDALIDGLSDGPPEVVIVPDRHGTGTNALMLTPPDVIEPAFGDDSRARHEERAAAAGAQVRVVQARSLLLDVDTCEDLEELRGVLERAPKGESVYTRDALSRIRPG